MSDEDRGQKVQTEAGDVHAGQPGRLVDSRITASERTDQTWVNTLGATTYLLGLARTCSA